MTGESVYTLNGPGQGRRDVASQWLLRAAPDPTVAIKEWNDGVAVLVAGRMWDAVRVPYALLDPAFSYDTSPEELRAWVTRLRLVGPSFCDPYRPYVYFFVPPGTDRTWPREEFGSPGVECLGGTTPYIHHIGVPRIDRTEQPGLFWLVPPDNVAFRHVDAVHLLSVLRQRREQTANQPEPEEKAAR